MKRYLIAFLVFLSIVILLSSIFTMVYLLLPSAFRFTMVNEGKLGRQSKTFWSQWKDKGSQYWNYKRSDYDHDRYDTIFFDVKENGLLYIMQGLERPDKDLRKRLYLFPIRKLYIIYLSNAQKQTLLELAAESAVYDGELQDFYWGEHPKFCYLLYQDELRYCGDNIPLSILQDAESRGRILDPCTRLIYALEEIMDNNRPLF